MSKPTSIHVAISPEEGMLLALYRAVPASTKQVVSGLLFSSWSEPLPYHVAETSARFDRAINDLGLGKVRISSLLGHRVPAMREKGAA